MLVNRTIQWTAVVVAPVDWLTNTGALPEKGAGRGAKVVPDAKIVNAQRNPRLHIQNFVTRRKFLKKFKVRRVALNDANTVPVS